MSPQTLDQIGSHPLCLGIGVEVEAEPKIGVEVARRVAESALVGGMAKVIAGMRRLQQAIETLVGVMVRPQPGGAQPRAEVGPHV